MRDVTVEADAPAHGTARAAWQTKDFRTFWLGAFGSNIGTWMQTLVLAAYVDERTESATMVGLFFFAATGPALLLSVPGGELAGRFPRRGLMIVLQAEQLVLSLGMAALVALDSHLAWLFVVQLLLGVGSALNNPVQQATMPELVDRRDVPGVISLNSAMINGTRVLGPVIAALIMTRGVTPSQIFLINAFTYLFIIYSITRVSIPPVVVISPDRGFAKLASGIRLARRRSVLGRLLMSMSVFSFVCLSYVALFASVSRTLFGVTGSGFKWLYAVWGVGCCVGAISIGTVLARFDFRRMVAPLFVGFSLSLTAFAMSYSFTTALVTGLVNGFFYFGVTTCMLTILQENLRSDERARVMALWITSFGGVLSISLPIMGPLMDALGARPVMLFGAAVGLWLAWWCDVSRRDVIFLDTATEHDERRS